MTCVFCDQNIMKNDAVHETENFFVKVGVGILGPGHVMIIPKKHVSCFGELPVNTWDEYEKLKSRVLDALCLKYSVPVLYEHGIYSQTVGHAHMHFLPKKAEHYTLTDVASEIFPLLTKTEIQDTMQMAEFFAREGSYFYLYEEGKQWLFHTQGLANGEHTFRKEFARLTGNSLIDWRELSEKAKAQDAVWVAATKSALQEEFQ